MIAPVKSPSIEPELAIANSTCGCAGIASASGTGEIASGKGGATAKAKGTPGAKMPATIAMVPLAKRLRKKNQRMAMSLNL